MSIYICNSIGSMSLDIVRSYPLCERVPYILFVLPVSFVCLRLSCLSRSLITIAFLSIFKFGFYFFHFKQNKQKIKIKKEYKNEDNSLLVIKSLSDTLCDIMCLILVRSVPVCLNVISNVFFLLLKENCQNITTTNFKLNKTENFQYFQNKCYDKIMFVQACGWLRAFVEI